MNSLMRYITDHRLDEASTMNPLQGNGIVSDVAVWARDVAECDCAAAVAWLREQQP